MPTLVKLSTNWADEMDIEGFFIWPENKEETINDFKQTYMRENLESIGIENLELSAEDLAKYEEADMLFESVTVNINQKNADMLLNRSVERYIGTNESIRFDNFSDYLNHHTFKEISQEEYDMINKLFGQSYGHNIDLGEDGVEVTFNIV